MNPLLQVIGSLLRHFLTALTGFLMSYGVSEVQAKELNESIITFAVAIISGAIALGWSYLQKNGFTILLEHAKQADNKTETKQLIKDAKKDEIFTTW